MPIGLSAFASSLWAGIPKGYSTNWNGQQTKLETAGPGSGTSMPPGLEATLEYNGLLMHDRTVLDKYRVTSIDGLQGADIRDNREANPSDHGETAFDNYLGGRTILIVGRVEGHNIGKLRDLQQSLRTAFTSMQERPLIFHTGNATRDVQIYARIIDKISMPEKQDDDRAFRDFQITLRASDPRFRSVVDRIASLNFGVLDNFTKATAATYLNQVQNPRAEINNTGFSYSNSGGGSLAAARVTDTAFGTNDTFQVSLTGGSAAQGIAAYSSAPSGVVAANNIATGKRYAYRIKARVAAITGGTCTSIAYSCRATNAAGTYLGDYSVIGASQASPTTGAVYDIVGYVDSTAIFTGQPTVAQLGINITAQVSAGTTAVDLRYGNIMICEIPPTQTTIPSYFDGDTYRGAWTGSPNASTSQYLGDDYTAGANFEQSTGNPAGSLWFDGTQMRVLQNGFNVILRRSDTQTSPDLRSTLKITLPPTNIVAEGGGGPGLWCKGVDINNFTYGRLNLISSTQARVDILKLVGGSVGGTITALQAGTAFTISAGTTYWLQTTSNGNVVTASAYASDPTVGSPTALSTTTATLTGGDITQFGTGVLGYGGLFVNTQIGNYPLDDFRIEPLTLNNSTNIINAGNFLALPKIRLYGPMTNPVITNLTIMPDETTTRSVKINGTIPSGRYYEYDANKGTLVDDLGANQFSKYDISSKQIQYASGTNLVNVTASALSGFTPQILSTHQDTWV